MDIKNSIEKFKNFTLNRLIEIIGILILFFSVLIFLALFSYNPNDPNFIYPEKKPNKWTYRH